MKKIIHASAPGYRRSWCEKDVDFDVEDMVTLQPDRVTCTACRDVIDAPSPLEIRVQYIDREWRAVVRPTLGVLRNEYKGTSTVSMLDAIDNAIQDYQLATRLI